MKLIDYDKRPINPHRWVQMLNDLAREFETFSVLHFGAGPGDLSRIMSKMPVKNYDPTVPEYADFPNPEDLVVCDRVLEYINPEEIDNVIDELKRATNMVLMVNIHLNYDPEHLNQNDIEFWLEKLTRNFDLQSVHGQNGREVTFVLYKRVEH